MLPILFSDNSVNHVWPFSPFENCRTFAIPHVLLLGGQSPHNLFWVGIQYSYKVLATGSNLAILLPWCSLNHIDPSSAPFSIQYGRVYASSGRLLDPFRPYIFGEALDVANIVTLWLLVSNL